MRQVLDYLKMIKIEHSLFALPFALSGMILAANGLPSLRVVIWIVVCMVAARSGAMGFNRWADADIDAVNPRTASREIPKGVISKGAALAFIIVSFAIFIFGAYKLNWLSFILSPIAILIFVLYSYMKRFTALCHIVLGVALGMAPIGAWVAVTGVLDPRIFPLGVGVLTWSAGFDLFYALQDMEHDKEHNLHSIPALIGYKETLVVARALHLLAFICFIGNGFVFELGFVYYIGLTLSGVILLYEHISVYARGERALGSAFFNMNAIISILLFISTAIDIATQ